MRRGVIALLCLVLFVGVKTVLDVRSPAVTFNRVVSDSSFSTMEDRHGQPLRITYQTAWNTSDVVPLYHIPAFLQQAFITAEDKRFYVHQGVDWHARFGAVWQRIRHGDASRGASSITEQVVRVLHPRPRTFWTKWLEGFEAMLLEQQRSKADILEFYLNQVPFAANRRGVVQAARFYFGRSLNTLSQQEMLALAVLVRAPSKFDLRQKTVVINGRMQRLAAAMGVSPSDTPLIVTDPQPLVYAAPFLEYVRQQGHGASRTTLDAGLQQFTQNLLDTRLEGLESHQVRAAAALVMDHQTGEVLAWVSTGVGCVASNFQQETCKIDMVRRPRQPASALKPFLYAAALEKGWTPATIIEDAPYANSVGQGLHRFHNYSHRYYGQVTLRQALGNSLNIPAVHTINFVGTSSYLQQLQALGFESLTRSVAYYDEGLALGSGEVSLFELLRGYATLANRGVSVPLRTVIEEEPAPKTRVFSEETASLIGNILSDPWARSLEFGMHSVLNFPTQTAVKTGTSTDYRDAWAMGYNHRYAVGVWMGNPDQTPMDGVTGSTGAALVLRGIFNKLEAEGGDSAPLFLSPRLQQAVVCVPQQNKKQCVEKTEYFTQAMMQKSLGRDIRAQSSPQRITLVSPAEGLQMAMDPRLSVTKQAFAMRVAGVLPTQPVAWWINGVKVGYTKGDTFLWMLTKGTHHVYAAVEGTKRTAEHWFLVK